MMTVIQRLCKWPPATDPVSVAPKVLAVASGQGFLSVAIGKANFQPYACMCWQASVFQGTSCCFLGLSSFNSHNLTFFRICRVTSILWNRLHDWNFAHQELPGKSSYVSQMDFDPLTEHNSRLEGLAIMMNLHPQHQTNWSQRRKL